MRRRALKMSVRLAVIAFLLSACCLDNGSLIPAAVCGGSMAWLFFMYLANK